MKKRMALFSIMLLVTAMSVLVTKGNMKAEFKEKDDLHIVTSFYPMYIVALNLIEGIDHVELTNLTENTGSCIHDYQLTTKDMKKLEHADVLIINGAGMEDFMNSTLKTYEQLSIIDASEGIDLLENQEHDGHEEEHEHESHNHGTWNGHVWMDPVKYQQQINTISEYLQQIDKKHRKQYAKNAEIYKKKIQQIEKELHKQKEKQLDENIIIFHDAFAYLGDRLGMKVIHQIDMDNETTFSAGEIAELVDDIKENNVNILLVEKQFSAAVPERIAKEANARVIVINSLVSGEMDKNAYIDGMRENIRIIKQELGI